MNSGDYQAALETLLTKLGILLNGARKHANHAVQEEFEPLQSYWLQAPKRVSSC